MKIPIFHDTNSFVITKTNGLNKEVNFGGHKVGLYYKLYSILRKKHNYYTKSARIISSAGCQIMYGSVDEILGLLIGELKLEHKYSIIDTNSDGGEVYHWRDDEESLIQQLNFIKEKYTSSCDVRLNNRIEVVNNKTGDTYFDKLDVLIENFSTFKETKETQPTIGVYLNFEEVLEDMRSLILNGNDKEKVGAKAILAYVATKLAEK